jgi:hypothetical protein
MDTKQFIQECRSIATVAEILADQAKSSGELDGPISFCKDSVKESALLFLNFGTMLLKLPVQ